MLTAIYCLAPPGAYWSDLIIPLVPSSPADPLFIRDVKGLEPVTATVNSRGYGVIDGEFYTSSRLGKRNIVITLALNPSAGSASIANSRSTIYSYFVPKGMMKLRFVLDDRSAVEIDGIVESVTGDRFVQDPELQISILCPKPNFLAATPVVVTGQTGMYDEDTPDSLAAYNGNAPGGITLEMEAGDIDFQSDIYIETKVTGLIYRVMRFRNLHIPQGWRLHVTTQQGNKQAEVRPPEDVDQAPLNAIRTMADISYWVTFHAAPNLFRVRAPFSDEPRDWTLTFQDQFIGV